MRTRFARLSLRWRLSWLLAAGTILSVALYGIAAYRTAHTLAKESAHARLRSALVQINTITELGSVTQLDMLRAAAADPAVIEALAHPELPLSEPAEKTLRRLQGTVPDFTTVELVGPNRTRVHMIVAQAPGPADQAFNAPPEGAIGPLYAHDGVMSFQSGIAIPAADGAIYVTRRLGSGSANRRIASNLLGPEAALLVGNQDGTLWSDAGVVNYPGTPGTPTRYVRDGIAWLSASATVKGTPWLNAVEIPEHVALAPARALVTPFILTGLLISIAATVVGMRVSQKIVTPLANLTAATEGIARGDRNVRLEATDREDEIGRLTRSFATMATSIRAIQDRLEAEVDTRSGELSAAVDRLRRLDEELRQSQRFANLGRLSGNVSHELRNPLGVMNTVVVLLDDLPDASPRIKHYAQLLREQIRLSERIINDLLDRARSDAPVCSTVDVERLLEELIGRTDLPSTIRVQREYQTPLPQVVLDRDQVGQIVWNLLTNAVQSMQQASVPEPTVTVKASVIDSRLRIEVSDSGPGVSADEADRIFEAMYTTKAHGVGLGLSISRAFARANGGDLFLAKTGGTGASFVLELPLPLGVSSRERGNGIDS
jgi:signal transduction histidine kinase